jgi:hypothetical protein
VGRVSERRAPEKSDYRHRRLLRARREWPRNRRAAEQRLSGFIGRDGDLEIVVSWRPIKDSERGGSRGRNRRARCPPRAKRRVDAVNQIIVAKWFWQVANNSETEGLGSNIFIRLSGNQNGGNAAAKRLEASM